VNNAGLPASYHDDIAQAQRDVQDAPRPSKRPKWVWLAIVAFVSALLPVIFWLLRPSLPTAVRPSSSPAASAVIQPNPSASAPSASPVGSASPTPSPDELLGHKHYDEAPQAELEPIASGIQMRKAAAAKFLAMVDAAQADGVSLVPISGFRSIADQTQLFFEVSAERVQSATTRSDVSAPPGYSEHHTGYVADIGDGDQPDTNLSQSFDQTAAFRWLSQNAPRFNFEMSFQKNNPDKVSYEPWHWRFVGDRQSLETFYKGKKK
jgi:zinc D-Ala-D-Ala carboxypeptidase